jgi:acetyl-CoA acyltransferase
MGITSENVAKEFGITRIDQDQLSVQSHARAASAKNKFQEEIVPVKTIVKDLKTNKPRTIIVRHDDGVRPKTNLESLGSLNPAFKKKGTTTAGNSSQVSDGAAAALMMSRSKCEQLGLKPLGTFKYFAVSGVPPHIMGIGPAYAIPKVCEMAGCNLSEIDLFEINEAFASQASAVIRELKIPEEKVNVNGGAIALGHPIGASGSRILVTLIHELKRQGKKKGCAALCIGGGMGIAMCVERN